MSPALRNNQLTCTLHCSVLYYCTLWMMGGGALTLHGQRCKWHIREYFPHYHRCSYHPETRLLIDNTFSHVFMSVHGSLMWPWLPMIYWTSPYMDPPPPLAPAPLPGPTPLSVLVTLAPDIFKLVHYEEHTVDKRAVFILLECFLVIVFVFIVC